MQMSANQGILPFGSIQKAAVSNATQALFAPLYGELLCCTPDLVIVALLHGYADA